MVSVKLRLMHNNDIIETVRKAGGFMPNILSKLFNDDARKLKQIEKTIQPVLDMEHWNRSFRKRSQQHVKRVTG